MRLGFKVKWITRAAQLFKQLKIDSEYHYNSIYLGTDIFVLIFHVLGICI